MQYYQGEYFLGALNLGNCLVKSWAVAQANILLSSGKAGFISAVDCCRQALAFQAMLNDRGCGAIHVERVGNSIAAVGIKSCTGLCKAGALQ